MASKDILKRINDVVGERAETVRANREQLERERRELVTSVGKDIADALMPYMQSMADRSQVTKEDLKAALAEVQINIPESQINIPEIRVPEARVTVDIPEIKLPQINIPQTNIQYPDRMKVEMDGVDNLKPLPVMMMGLDGKPFSFPMGTTGGKADFLTIKDIRTSSGASAFNADGQLRVTGDLTVTGSASSTYAVLVNADGTSYDSANPLPITGSLSTTPGATFYASDAIGSMNLIQVGGNAVVVGTGYQDNALRVVHATDAVTSVNIVSSASITVASITASTAVNLSDSTGVGYSGSNPVPVTLVSGGLTSTIVVGSVVADAVDDGSAPVQGGGIARTANPTAVAGNDVVKSTHDDLGRQVMRPVQVRDLMATAYATLTNGTETTLLAASAGSFHDLVYIMGSNSSDAAVTVDIRPVTAGNVVMTLGIPAYGTAGVACPVPYPQSASDTGNNWTADMGDITGTTVYLSGLFTREV